MAPVLIALGLLVVTAGLSLVFHRRRGVATAVGMAGAVAGMAACLFAAVPVLLGRPVLTLVLPIRLPIGTMAFGLDPLTAFFLVPLSVLGAITAIYGRGYWLSSDSPRQLGVPACLFNVLLASMVSVVVARDLFFLVMAWEGMTLSSFLLVTLDHADPNTRRAGWIYLVAAHVGEVCLLGLTLLCGQRAGGTGFSALATLATQGGGGLLFALALVGFGIKAGFLPFHVWLPKAHAAAPSQVSALMSGVLVKMGLYGLLRTMSFLPPSPSWGPVLMVLGMVGAVWGIGMALSQRDIKRVLAYSTVENMGIITVGLGLGYWRWGRGDHALGTLAVLGALFHVWNHAVMKGLMFLCAGSVIHGSGTRDMERMGGLLRRMPFTGTAMLVGAVAIAGLPPLCGFVGEWLIYFGFLGGGLSGGGASGIAVLLATGVFALVGGMAALCFVRLFGVVWLGEPRSTGAAHAHESSNVLTYPIGFLAMLVALLGTFPILLLPALAGVARQILGEGVVANVMSAKPSLWIIGLSHGALWAGMLMVGAVAWKRLRTRATPVETWGCGYLAPTARMQYTARSFSEFMSDRLLPRFLRSKTTRVPAEGLFPPPGSLSTDTTDPMVRDLYRPLFRFCAHHFARLRWLQQGALHLYLLYIFILAVAALGWISWSSWMAS